MSQTFARFGSPKDHESATRFWTLRFDQPVRAKAPITEQIRDSVGALADTSVMWAADDRVEIDVSTERFDDRRWDRVVSRVEALIDAIHAEQALFAVVFAGYDDLHEAPRATVELYARLKRARGRNRARLVAEALSSGHTPLEDLALRFVASVVGDEALWRFAAGSPDAQARAQAALAEAIQRMAFDYGKKPTPVHAVLEHLRLPLASGHVARSLSYAAVRDAPSMGKALHALADRDADVYEALSGHWRALDDAAAHIALAFGEAERGHSDNARVHLARARERYPEPKSPLWRETIPAWLDALETRTQERPGHGAPDASG